MITRWQSAAQTLTAPAPQSISAHNFRLSVPLTRGLPHRRVYAALVPFTGHVYSYTGRIESFDPTTSQKWFVDLLAGTTNDSFIGYGQTLKQKTVFRTLASAADMLLHEDETLPPDGVRLVGAHIESPDFYESCAIITPFYMSADAERLDFDLIAVLSNENSTLSAKLRAVLLVQEQDTPI